MDTAINCTYHIASLLLSTNYFNHRVGRNWNALPCDEVDFSSLRCFRNMKLFKTTDIEVVKYCQNIIFRFDLPSVRLTRLKTRFYSLVQFG